MQERDIVLDVLNQTKASLATYAKVITECGNQDLRQKFQQMRDSDEQFQYNLYKLADQKGYYVPSPAVTPQDASAVKSSLTEWTAQ
jgi:spore coat protein CotF